MLTSLKMHPQSTEQVWCQIWTQTKKGALAQTWMGVCGDVEWKIGVSGYLQICAQISRRMYRTIEESRDAN